MTELAKVAKVRLYPNQQQAQAFRDMTVEYQRLCNLASEWLFNHDFPMNSNVVNKALYRDFRKQSDLNSQMVQSVFRTVIARYKTVKRQLQSKPYRYQNEHGRWVTIKKDLTWLWRPIQFKRPQADLVRQSNWSILNNGQLMSLSTMCKRTKLAFNSSVFTQSLLDWKNGTAKLLESNGKWYLHISLTKEVTDIPIDKPTFIGIDRGLRFLATTYDHNGQTRFFNGQKIMTKRRKYRQLRNDLQTKNTHSSRKKLKQIGHRENRWMTDVNHQITKTLVDQAPKGTVFVLEDLTGVSFNRDDLSKSQRNTNSSWSFYQFEQFLTYKAKEKGLTVVKVDPAHTSQICPKCGYRNKDNRHHLTHDFCCGECGYRSNDDRIGAMNIQALGKAEFLEIN